MRVLILLLVFSVSVSAQFPAFPKYPNFKPQKYNPVDGSTVALYLADVGITLVSDSVSVWADQGPNKLNLTQTTQVNRPKQAAGDSVVFDGTNDFLSVSSALLNFGGGNFTVEIYLYNTTVGADAFIVKQTSGFADGWEIRGGVTAGDSKITVVHADNGSTNFKTAALLTNNTLNSKTYAALIANGDNLQLDVNNSILRSTPGIGAYNADVANSMRVGYRENNSLPFDGGIYAIRISSKARDTDERANFRAYLIEKFGE